MRRNVRWGPEKTADFSGRGLPSVEMLEPALHLRPGFGSDRHQGRFLAERLDEEVDDGAPEFSHGYLKSECLLSLDVVRRRSFAIRKKPEAKASDVSRAMISRPLRSPK